WMRCSSAWRLFHAPGRHSPPVNTSGLTRPYVASSHARVTGSDLSPTLQALVLSPKDLALSQPERGGWRWVVICSAAPSSRVMPTALHRDDAGWGQAQHQKGASRVSRF